MICAGRADKVGALAGAVAVPGAEDRGAELATVRERIQVVALGINVPVERVIIARPVGPVGARGDRASGLTGGTGVLWWQLEAGKKILARAVLDWDGECLVGEGQRQREGLELHCEVGGRCGAKRTGMRRVVPCSALVRRGDLGWNSDQESQELD